MTKVWQKYLHLYLKGLCRLFCHFCRAAGKRNIKGEFTTWGIHLSLRWLIRLMVVSYHLLIFNNFAYALFMLRSFTEWTAAPPPWWCHASRRGRCTTSPWCGGHMKNTWYVSCVPHHGDGTPLFKKANSKAFSTFRETCNLMEIFPKIPGFLGESHRDGCPIPREGRPPISWYGTPWLRTARGAANGKNT